MRRHLPAILLIITLALLASCASYTARDAMPSITIPTADRSELPVTKHSLIVAEREAEAARIEEMSAQETINFLQTKVEELESTVAVYEQDDTIQRLQADARASAQLIDEQKAALARLDEEIKGLGEERLDLVRRLTAADDTLDEQQRLISEQEERIVDLGEQADEGQHSLRQLDAATTAIGEQQQLIDEQRAQIARLNEEIRALSEERQALSIQLAIASAALDEQQRIEAAAEAERIQAEQRRLLAQEQEAERLERERQAEEARLEKARELERLIPPLSELTLPHRYVINSAAKVIPKGSILKTLLLPLSDVPWRSGDLVDSVALSIGDLDAPVIFVTGAMENVIALVRRLAANAILLEGGAVITPLEVVETTKNSVQVRLNGEQTVRLSLANLVEYEVLSSFLDGTEKWKEAQKRISDARLKRVLSIARAGLIVEPTIFAASLYEPSHQDWSSFSPITYRQVDYLWPLSAALEEEQFLDVYRLTHFSADTDSGNTIALATIKERVDYLFSRKLLPLSSTIIPIGGESTPRDGEVQRWGIAASLLIP